MPTKAEQRPTKLKRAVKRAVKGMKPVVSRKEVKRPMKQPSFLVFRDLTARAEKRGRKNFEFPQLNIRETARRMEINESHLGRLLSRKCPYQPSLKTAKKLA